MPKNEPICDICDQPAIERFGISKSIVFGRTTIPFAAESRGVL